VQQALEASLGDMTLKDLVAEGAAPATLPQRSTA
jgi:hypothetical protein